MDPTELVRTTTARVVAQMVHVAIDDEGVGGGAGCARSLPFAGGAVALIHLTEATG